MSILIVKTSSLGDIVQAFPVLEAIKQKFPHVSIDWVVEKPFAPLLQAHPLINQVLTIDSKEWRHSLLKKETWKELSQFKKDLQNRTYDWVFDLQGNTKSAGITALAKSKHKVGFGWDTAPEWPNCLWTHQHVNPPEDQSIQKDYLTIVQNVIGESKKEKKGIHLLTLNSDEQEQFQIFNQQLENITVPKLMICPGSQWMNKQLSIDILQEFLQLVNDHFPVYFVFVWGSSDELQMVFHLSKIFHSNSLILDKGPLALLQHCMQKVDGVFAMDSLPLHLAATTETPTYSVFGASLAQKYQPLGPQHESFQGTCPYEKRFDKRCPILRTCSTGDCIKSIDAEELFDHFSAWWQKFIK